MQPGMLFIPRIVSFDELKKKTINIFDLFRAWHKQPGDPKVLDIVIGREIKQKSYGSIKRRLCLEFIPWAAMVQFSISAAKVIEVVVVLEDAERVNLSSKKANRLKL